MNLRRLIAAVVAILAASMTTFAFSSSPAQAATLQEITNFGNNPSACGCSCTSPRP